MAARPGESIQQYDGSIHSALAVTPSDTIDLARVTRGIYVGVSGNVTVLFCDDADAATVLLTGLSAGIWHPMQVRRVLATGTAATGIVAGY